MAVFNFFKFYLSHFRWLCDYKREKGAKEVREILRAQGEVTNARFEGTLVVDL